MGPGQFVFDSHGATGVVLDPPVSFPSFVVLVGGAPFTPMSAVDDGLVLNSAGFVSALDVDVNPASGTQFLQLSENRTYTSIDSLGATVGTGTYSIVATPEPTYVGLLGLGLCGLFLRFLRRT